MAFRLLHQHPTYLNSLGGLLAGGTLNFYITATSTPKNVYSSKTLGTSLGSTITLDSDGRHSEDIWLAEDVAYRVIAKDSLAVTQWTMEDVRSLDTSVSADLPSAASGTAGQALFTDGTAGGWYFAAISAIPSQTGNSGKLLTTDGAALSWATQSTYSSTNLPGGITSTAAASGSVVIGTVRLQWGADTAPTAAGFHTSKAVTFGTAFLAAPYHVSIQPLLASGVTDNAPADWPLATYSGGSTTGFTAQFHCPGENEVGAGLIDVTSAIPFTWFAVGRAV